eukprot:s273_g14.t1
MIKSQGRFHTYMETELHFLKQEIAALRLGSSLTEQSPRTLLSLLSGMMADSQTKSRSVAGGSAAGGSVTHSSASRTTAASAASSGSQAKDAGAPLARAPRRMRDDEGDCTCDRRMFRPRRMPKCSCPNDDPDSLQDKHCKCTEKYLPAFVRPGKNCPCRKVFGAVYNVEVYRALGSDGPLWERLEKDKRQRQNADAGVEALPVNSKAVDPGPGASPGQPAAPATSSILSSVGTAVDQTTAVQVMWSARPWLEHPAIS